MTSILFDLGRELVNEVQAGVKAHNDVRDGKEAERRQDKWGDPLAQKTVYSVVRGVEENFAMMRGKVTGQSKDKGKVRGAEEAEGDASLPGSTGPSSSEVKEVSDPTCSASARRPSLDYKLSCRSTPARSAEPRVDLQTKSTGFLTQALLSLAQPSSMFKNLSSPFRMLQIQDYQPRPSYP